MNDPYAYIRDGLVSIVHSAESYEMFGSDSHHFKTNSPLSEDEVAEFESKYSIRLPNEYRGFLINVGNGGAGPHYGLFRLGEMDGLHGDEPWKEGSGVVGFLAKPFPHREAWNDLSGFPEFDESRSDDPAYEDLYFQLRDEWQDRHYWNSQFINGALPLSHRGCAMRDILVVSGPERGNVWLDDRSNESGIMPVEIDGKQRVTFLEWYLSWLNNTFCSKS